VILYTFFLAVTEQKVMRKASIVFSLIVTNTPSCKHGFDASVPGFEKRSNGKVETTDIC
jgi:hypothetical protein